MINLWRPTDPKLPRARCEQAAVQFRLFVPHHRCPTTGIHAALPASEADLTSASVIRTGGAGLDAHSAPLAACKAIRCWSQRVVNVPEVRLEAGGLQFITNSTLNQTHVNHLPSFKEDRKSFCVCFGIQGKHLESRETWQMWLELMLTLAQIFDRVRRNVHTRRS